MISFKLKLRESRRIAGVSDWPPNPRYILDNQTRARLFHPLLQWTFTGWI